MRYHFMTEHEEQFRIGAMCRVLCVSRSGYYSWRNRPESERAKENEELLLKIKAAHKKSKKKYGSPHEAEAKVRCHH